MKTGYIPDENVIILAQIQEDDQGNPDLTCLRLIRKILDTPAARIIVDESIWDKYWEQAQKQQFHSLPRNLLYELSNTDIGKPDPDGSWPHKITLLPNAPCFPEETQIPAGSQDDLQFIRLAVHTRATLVTTDQPLIQELQAAGITQQYGLSLLTPAQALRQFPPQKEPAKP